MNGWRDWVDGTVWSSCISMGAAPTGLWLALPALLGVSISSAPALASTALQDRGSVAEIAIDLVASSGLLVPNEVLQESPGDSAAFGGLAAAVADPLLGLSAYHIDAAAHSDSQIFSLAAPAMLGGGGYAPADAVRWNTSAFSAYVSATSWGIPAGVSIDAVSQGASAPAISLDQTTEISNGGPSILVSPEDLVELTATPSLIFDGSVAGIPAGVNLDAAHRLSNGNLLLSFDLPISLGGGLVMPEDVAEWNGASWELAIDASAVDSGWIGTNLTGFYAVAAVDDGCPDELNPSQADGDGDSVQDACDDEPGNATACRDQDEDGCDDCTSGIADTGNDGSDFEGDGLCDVGDPDRDDDMRANELDSDDFNAFQCADTDYDLCDDCSGGVFDSTSDGVDTDGDGLCDTGEASVNSNASNEDTDGDGYCDGPVQVGTCIAAADNCPNVANAGQENGDIYRAGDACQCGDADGDGLLSADDLMLARMTVAGRSQSPPGYVPALVVGDLQPERCDASGTGAADGCDIGDVFVLARVLAGSSGDEIHYSCDLYRGVE